MQRSLVIIMIITLLVVIFALQNNTNIRLEIWFWQIDIHTGLVLIMTFTLGTLLGIVSSLPRLMKRKREIRDLKEKLAAEPDQQESEASAASSADPAMSSDKNEPEDPEFEDINGN